MNKTIFITLFFVFSSLTASAQYGGTGITTLPLLGLKSKSIETILNDIDTFIGNKPSGLQFPVTKLVFSELEDLMCFEIVGIDNSWKDLFKFGEVPYGYIIMQNRLFLISGEGYHDIDLTPIFYMTDKNKTFNKNSSGSSGIDRNPTWFFEYKNEQSYLIGATDLDILD